MLREGLMREDMDRADTIPMEDRTLKPAGEQSLQAGVLPIETVDVEMASIEDGGSIASTGTSLIGEPNKRKLQVKGLESSDGEEKMRITRRWQDSVGKKEPSVQSKKKGPMIKMSETKSTSYSESEAKRSGRTDATRKKSKGKRPKESVESKLRDVPANDAELEMAPASELGASALEWLEDLEMLRAKSTNIQGGWSGHMRKRVHVVKEAMRILVEKSVQIGDPSYLRRRNQDLCSELKVAQAEIGQLKTTVKDLQAVVGELKKSLREMESPPVKASRDKATSPLEARLVRAAMDPIPDIRMSRPREMEDRQERPCNVFHLTDKEREEELTKQIDALVARRRKVRRIAAEEKTALPQRVRKGGNKPNVVEDHILGEGEKIVLDKRIAKDQVEITLQQSPP